MLRELKETFQSLQKEVNQIIVCVDESSRNYSSLSEGMANLTKAEDPSLQQLCKDISQTLQYASISKKNELDDQIRKLKEPIDDYIQMVQAAEDACQRRRALV